MRGSEFHGDAKRLSSHLVVRSMLIGAYLQVNHIQADTTTTSKIAVRFTPMQCEDQVSMSSRHFSRKTLSGTILY
jgi:hypothetical protein